jgi:hypothetical protein
MGQTFVEKKLLQPTDTWQLDQSDRRRQRMPGLARAIKRE